MLNNPNRMIQALCRSPDGIAKLNEDPESNFDAYGLNESEKEALRSNDTLVMVNKGGVHPILAMHYLLATNPGAADSMSISKYAGLLEDARWPG